MQRILGPSLGIVRWLGLCFMASLRAPAAWLLLAILPYGAQTNAAWGQDSISQMYHKSWTSRDGAPDNIEQIAQGVDGFLWLATDNGLYHFDGRSFERYTPPGGGSLLSDSLYALNVTRDGSLWVSYFFGGGLTRIRDGKITNFTTRDGLQSGQIYSVVQGQDGSFWISGPRGLQTITGSRVSDVEIERGVPHTFADLAMDTEGNLWAAFRGTLFVLPRRAHRFLVAESWPGGDPHSVGSAVDKGIWFWRRDGALDRFELSEGRIIKTAVSSTAHALEIAPATDGSLWIATQRGGVEHLPANFQAEAGGKNGQPEIFTSREGLTSDSADSVIEGREGSIWVATAKGLDQFRPMPFHPVDLGQGVPVVLPQGNPDPRMLVGTGCLVRLLANPPACVSGSYHEWTRSLYTSDDGTLWIGTFTRLLRFARGKFSAQAMPANLNDLSWPALTIVEDDRHRIWVSVGLDNGLFRFDGKQWQKDGGYSGLPKARALAARRDHAGAVWFGFVDGRAARISNDGVRVFGKSEGLDIGGIKVFALSGDDVWLGGDTGVAVVRDGRFVSLHLTGEELFRGVTGLAFAPDGALWISQSSGVLRIDKAELSSSVLHPGYAARYQSFDSHDGLQGIPHPIVGLGSAWMAPDGRLYVATSTSLQWIDPLHLSHNDLPPPVWITNWKADDQAGVWPSVAITLKPHLEALQINYAATSLLIPERVQFRYRLDGYDEAWIEAGTRREAFYSKLPPGRYVFRVIACNNSGVWNDNGASFVFTVPPTFTQTFWFKLAIAGAVALLVWYVFSLRLAQLKARMYERMQERIAERERIARDLHDTFFQGIQGLLLRFNTATSQLKKDEPARIIFEETLKQSDQVMLEGRELVLDLRAFASEPQDLPTALADYGKSMQVDYPCEFVVAVNGNIRPLNSMVCDELIKIGKEVLSNAFRHSGAPRIEAELNYGPSELQLRFRDNGTGIDPKILKDGSREGHWGLPGLRERARNIAARLEIWSRAGAGAEVEVRLSADVAYAQNRPRGMAAKLRDLWFGRERRPSDL